jgi:hypothetical protein
MTTYKDILALIEVDAATRANEEMAAPEFEFKKPGERITTRRTSTELIPALPDPLEKLKRDMEEKYKHTLSVMLDEFESIKLIKIGLANIQHVQDQIANGKPSGMVVGVHNGSIDSVKSALNTQLKGKFTCYKPMERRWGSGPKEAVTGVWHIIMTQGDASTCKLFGLLDGFGIALVNLSEVTFAHYKDPEMFIRK